MTLSEEVLEARMVVGRQTLSSRVKISIFDSISSGTASITRSASRAACSTDEAYSSRPNAPSASALRDLSQLDGFIEVGANLSLRLAQGGRENIFQDGAIAAQRGGMRDAAAHDAGADDGDGADLGHPARLPFPVARRR